MRGKRWLFIAFTLLLLLLSPKFVHVSLAQPSQGNWVVTGTQVVQNEAITLNGNLTVENGGNLTLGGVNLAIKAPKNGEYGIFVLPGGALYIRNSAIRSADGIHRYTFRVSGGNFVMENTAVADAGWCDIQPDLGWLCSGQGSVFNGYQGLQVDTNDALIQNDTISGSGIGITLGGLNDVVRGDIVTSSNGSSLVLTYGLGGSDSFTNDTVVGNELHQEGLLNTGMVTIYSSGNKIENNSLDYHLLSNGESPTGISDGGWANEIKDNSIVATLGILLGNGVSDDTVAHNTITFCAQGIWTWQSGSENLIMSNTLTPGFIDSCNGMYQTIGIQISGIRDSIIESNLFHVPPGVPSNPKWNPASSLLLVQTYHSQILDNNFTFSGSQPPLYVVDSADDVLEGNSFSSPLSTAWASVYLDASNNNTITNNSFNGSVNSTYSIALDQSDYNSVYANNFNGAGEVAFDGGYGNAWSSGPIGNFWSSYNGSGSYRIPPNGTDAHPLNSPVNISLEPIILPSPIRMPQAYAGPQCYFSISNTTTISNGSSVCPAGFVEIKPGGHLTYIDESLAFGTGGVFSFQIDSGATLSIINSTVSWEGAGYQNIAAGGSIKIDGSDLTVTGPSPVPLVFQGSGDITIEKSSIRTAQGSTGFDIRGQGNGSIDVVSTLLQGGSTFDDGLAMIGQGVIQPTDHPRVVVENSIIEDSPAGISISGQDAVLMVANDTFKSVDQPLATNLGIGTATVSHSLFYSSADGLRIAASNVSVSYNKLLRSWQGGVYVECGSGYGISCRGAGSTIGNIIRNSAGLGLSILMNDTVITNNTLLNSGPLSVSGIADAVYGNAISGGGGLALSGSSLEVFGNIINESKNGLSIYASNSRVFDNTITDSQVGVNAHGSNLSIYHNSIVQDVVPAYTSPSGVSWSFQDEGNYWSNYNGSDRDLDGIGDTPFNYGDPSLVAVVTDNYPFVQPNGWLTKFYLTMDSNVPSLAFSIDGSNFQTGQGGTGTYKLGYEANYLFFFPESVTLANGTTVVFSRWSDGYALPARTLYLSSNSTEVVVYKEQAVTTTTTTSSFSTTTIQTSTGKITTTATTQISPTASGTGTGGIPEFPYQLLVVAGFAALLAVGYLMVRNRQPRR